MSDPEKRGERSSAEKADTASNSTAVSNTTPPNVDAHHVDVEQAKTEFEQLRRSLSRASSLHRVETGQKSLEAPDDDDFDLTEYLVRLPFRCPTRMLTSCFSAPRPLKPLKLVSAQSISASTGKTSRLSVREASRFMFAASQTPSWSSS